MVALKASGLHISCGSEEALDKDRGIMTMSNETYEKGLQIRREVIGADYVDQQSADDFSQEYHDIINEHFWGAVWGRPGLSRKQRILISLGMLAALKRDLEFELHLTHALDNGVSIEELKETLIHISAYCGAPTGAAAFRIAGRVINEGK